MAILNPPQSLALELLTPNPLNPRGEIDPASVEDLAASIAAQGILQPLLVTPDGVVVAGHRRRLAAIKAGLVEVPVLMRELTEAEQLEIMLVENIQREDLSPVQEARAYRRLVDSGMTQADVARRIGVNHARVQARLKLLELDDEVLERFHRLELPLVFAPVLLKVTEPHQQRPVFQDLTPGCVRADATKVVQVMGLRLDVNKGGWFAVIPDYRRFVVHSELRMIWNRPAKRIRPLILERDRRRCVRCGSTERLEVDHVISLARGGSSEVENLQTLCLPCNRAKGAR